MKRWLAFAGIVAVLAAAQVQVGAASDLPTFTRDEALALTGARVPDGVGVIVHTDYPATAPLAVAGAAYYSLTLDFTPTGEVITRNAIADADGGATSGSGVAECEDPAFKPLGVRWRARSIPVLWRLDLRSIPDYLKTEKTKLTIRSAHRVWPQSQTDCSEGDRNGFHYNYLGHTRRNPKYDKVNIVDFGALPNKALAQNYTWYRGTEIVEVDLRLSNGYSWTNVDGVKRFQVKNVVTHELGHQVGLDDLGAPHGDLTMYSMINRGEMKKITLGFGDLKGAWTVSP